MSEIKVKRVAGMSAFYMIPDGIELIGRQPRRSRRTTEGWSIGIEGRESNDGIEVTLYLSREEITEDCEGMYINATLGEKEVAQLIRELQDVIDSLKEEQ